MPHILPKERSAKDEVIDKLFERCESKGDVNYCITRLIHLWVLKQMEKVKSLTKKYDIINDAYGIMCSATGEFYAAVMVPYEKLKRKENGFVSQLDEFADGAPPTGKYKCDICARLFDILNRKEISGRYIFYCPHCGSEEYTKY